MNYPYIIADACGNTTAFVLAQVSSSRRGPLARQVLEALGVEQVGYIHNGHMDMMGGEFCGNASRAFALWQTLQKEGPWPRQECITVSGADHPLPVCVRREDGGYRAAIGMPLPQQVQPFLLGDTPVTRVTFDGITHLVCAGREPREGDLALALADIDTDALGLLYVQGDHMRPLVWVRDTDSRCWESSCASGTCAVAAARAFEQGKTVDLTLAQPGGALSARCEICNHQFTSLTLDGPVALMGEGTLRL